MYGQLCTRNVLLSFYDCSIKLGELLLHIKGAMLIISDAANIADSILKPQRQSYSDDIHDIGTLLVSFKEPGTFRRNPKGLLLEKDDVSEHCKRFIQETATSSLKQLINVSYQAKEKLGKDNMLIFQSMISSSNLPDQVG